jgi:predicted transcriptional regulator
VRDLARRKRSQIEIIAEILQAATGTGVTKTSLVYKSNLNFTLIQKYIALLTDKGLLEVVQAGPVLLYRTTDKGAEALKLIIAAESVVLGRPIEPS